MLSLTPAIQAVIVICLICAIGLFLGKIRVRGISLGVTYVFFIGILAGALGIDIDAQMLSYAESFGLILFVYILGLQVGPGFMSSFRSGGARLNLLALGVVLLGTFMSLFIVWGGFVPIGDMMGVLCGATTNTPALGAAQQTLKQLGQPSSGAALSCAVTYPLGMVGVIVAIIIMRGWLTRHERQSAKKATLWATNRSLDDILASYGDRFFSRLVAPRETMVLRLEGDDLRLRLK